MKKIALSVAALVAAFITFASPAQAHCQPGYHCWAQSQGHYRNQQRWSYGPRQMFQPQFQYGYPRYQQPRRHYGGTILVPRGTIYIPY